MSFELREMALEDAPWHQLQLLLDKCFAKPPQDVFERVVSFSHRSQRLWLSCSSNGELLGMVMLSPHSKGGHLDNLAVTPSARGQGIAHALVSRLLLETASSTPVMVSLTTRIPEFFEPFGFKVCGQLADGSTGMYVLLPNSPSPKSI